MTLVRKDKGEAVALQSEERTGDFDHLHVAQEQAEIGRSKAQKFRKGGKIGKFHPEAPGDRPDAVHEPLKLFAERRKIVEVDADPEPAIYDAQRLRIGCKIEEMPCAVYGGLALHHERETVLPCQRAAADGHGQLRIAQSQIHAAVKGDRLVFDERKEFVEHGLKVDVSVTHDIDGIAGTQRNGRAKRLRVGGNTLPVHFQFDVARQIVDAERAHDVVAVDDHREHAVCRGDGVRDLGKIERKKVIDGVHLFFVLRLVEPQRGGDEIGQRFGLGTQAHVVHDEEHVAAGIFERHELADAAHRKIELRPRDNGIDAEVDIAENIQPARFHIDAGTEIVRRKQGGKRLGIGQDIDVSLRLHGGNGPLRERDIHAEGRHLHRAVLDRDHGVARIQILDGIAEQFKQLVGLDGKRDRTALARERCNGAELAREHGVEQAVEVKPGALLQRGKLHIFAQQGDRLVGIRKEPDPVHLEIGIAVRIGDGDQLFGAVHFERQLARRPAARQRQIDIAAQAVALPFCLAFIVEVGADGIGGEERRDRRKVRPEIDKGCLFRLGERSRLLLAEAKAEIDDKVVRLDPDRERTEGDPPLLIEEEGKFQGQRNIFTEGEFGDQRRPVVRIAEIAVAELLHQILGERLHIPDLLGQGQYVLGEQLLRRRPAADAAIGEISRALLHPEAEHAEVGAQSDVLQRHIADIQPDRARERPAVHRHLRIKGDGAFEHAPEGFGKAADDGRNGLYGLLRLSLPRIAFKVLFVSRALRTRSAVFKVGHELRRAVDADAQRRAVRFIHHALEHLPVFVKRELDLNGGKLGKFGQPAREHHLIGIIGRRLVPRGIEIIGLCIGAVRILHDGIGGEQRLLVDDVNAKLAGGETVFRLEILHAHAGIGLARLPLHREHLVEGVGVIAVAQPPEHLVSDIAELPRRFYERARRHVRHDEDVPGMLLVGTHRLRHDGGIRLAVHFGIPRLLRMKDGIHVADVLEGRMIGGRGTVLRHVKKDGGKSIVHDVGLGFLEKARHDDGRRDPQRQYDSDCGENDRQPRPLLLY